MNGPPFQLQIAWFVRRATFVRHGRFHHSRHTERGREHWMQQKGGFWNLVWQPLVSTKFQLWVQSHATGPLSMCHRGFWSLVQQLLDCLTWKLTISNLGTKELWRSPEGVVLALGNAWNAAAAASGELCLSRTPRYWHASSKGQSWAYHIHGYNDDVD